MYSSALSLTSAQHGDRWLMPGSGRLTPGKETRYPLLRRLGGVRSGQVRKVSPPQVFDPRTGSERTRPIRSPF